ncbi:zinc transporter ZIP1 [Parasteatoda tepidariorum]|uniref:zinc transporter ZIP1 n=1 Tax=Parasteatoda tepidariorum TaxID=114398 RepID=UPI00077FA28E|nr:zinc transporter ZIP1 [Parasteatoda tepidariorum]
METDILVARVVCLFLLLIGTLIFGILPVFVKKTLFQCDCVGLVCKPNCRARRGKIVTSFLIYFGGGVLLGTTFLHLLPEAREGFEKEEEAINCTAEFLNPKPTEPTKGDDHDHEKFPIPEFIVCIGFFAVYLFEEIIHFYLGGHTHVPSENRAIRSFSRSNSCSQPGSLENSMRSKRASTISEKAAVDVMQHSNLGQTFSLAALLTVAALSFHSLFEGFAIGLRPDATSTWIVFAAISVHKYVISFVVGLEVLATGGKNMHVYTYMSVFALMSPLGMAIAMITESNLEESNPLTVSVLNAIATGTLLYVTFFEILQREEHKDIATWVQLIATLTGFVVMAIMQYVSTLA